MPPKRTSTSEAPAMTQAAIRKLVADSVTATLEAQAATMTNADNTNRNTEERKAQDTVATKNLLQPLEATNAPHESGSFSPSDGPSQGPTHQPATITSHEDSTSVLLFTTPPNGAEGQSAPAATPTHSKQGSRVRVYKTTMLEWVPRLNWPSDFVSQNYETLVALMQEETKKRSSQSLQARLNFGPEDEVSPPRHQKERRRQG
ncbi:hypothetical protein Tco_1030330 [Tanacetum coccineum]|uniref:Uncharacterized protein n=1 Tax=Tanacetum coccineum TaxID=301880 RepID=A0ABQ5G7M2_9ASTR